MKVGVRSHDFGRMSEVDLPKTIKDAGFESVQLAITKAITGIISFKDIKSAHIQKIREEFFKNGLEINVLGCYIEPSLLDKEKRLENVEIFKKSIEQAKELGVSIVGTETTHFNFEDENRREEIYQLLKDSVLRMVEKAEKENVIVGIEPVAEHTLNTPKLTKRLLDEVNSSKLKIIFDPVNLLLPNTINKQEEIYESSFNLFGNEIAVAHIKDIVIRNNQKEWRNIGKGIINYNYIFNWLNKNKQDIHILRENVKMDSYNEDLNTIKTFIK